MDVANELEVAMLANEIELLVEDNCAAEFVARLLVAGINQFVGV